MVNRMKCETTYSDWTGFSTPDQALEESRTVMLGQDALTRQQVDGKLSPAISEEQGASGGSVKGRKSNLEN